MRPTVPAESFGQQRRFLVVDDHPVNRLLVRHVLQRHWPEAEVVEVENGEKALQAFEQGVPWDLVLMDMVMPVMDGIEATRGIKASLQESVRRTPVVGLTANVNPQDLALFEQVGLDALLLKPFIADHLRKEVERLLKLRDSSLRS
jgi:CheY-like chemotaxis protein